MSMRSEVPKPGDRVLWPSVTQGLIWQVFEVDAGGLVRIGLPDGRRLWIEPSALVHTEDMTLALVLTHLGVCGEH